MLAQTAARPDVLSMSGDLVEGGTFRMAVHKHDDSLPMTLGFGWTAPPGPNGGAGVSREAAIAFKWDPERRAALRWRTEIRDGTDSGVIEGSWPWGDQPAVAILNRVTADSWAVLDRVHFVVFIALARRAHDDGGPGGGRLRGTGR
jgi:hypothetical protein